MLRLPKGYELRRFTYPKAATIGSKKAEITFLLIGTTMGQWRHFYGILLILGDYLRKMTTNGLFVVVTLPE